MLFRSKAKVQPASFYEAASKQRGVFFLRTTGICVMIRPDLRKFYLKSPESWLYLHLFNSSLKTKTLNNSFACPPQPHFFKEQPVHGQGSPHAVPSLSKEGREVLPTPKAKALVSYLLSLRKDDAVPYSLNYSRNKKKAD